MQVFSCLRKKCFFNFLGATEHWYLPSLATKVGFCLYLLLQTTNILPLDQLIIPSRSGMVVASNACTLLMNTLIKSGEWLIIMMDPNSCLFPRTKTYICTAYLFEIKTLVLLYQSIMKKSSYQQCCFYEGTFQRL